MCAHHMNVWHSIPAIDAILAPHRFEFMIMDDECGGGVPGNIFGHSHGMVRFRVIDVDGTAWGNWTTDERSIRNRPDLYMPLHAINGKNFDFDDGHGQKGLGITFNLEIPVRELVTV